MAFEPFFSLEKGYIMKIEDVKKNKTNNWRAFNLIVVWEEKNLKENIVMCNNKSTQKELQTWSIFVICTHFQ